MRCGDLRALGDSGFAGILEAWHAHSVLLFRDQALSDADLIASDLVYPHVRGETSSVEFNAWHRWYYFSEMQTDEVVLIRVHDSANDGRAQLSFHTAFDNPLAAGAPPRESIEVRALVFFPPA